MQGAEERRLRRICNTPQGEAIESNTEDDTLMVDQGECKCIDSLLSSVYKKVKFLGGEKVNGQYRHTATTQFQTCHTSASSMPRLVCHTRHISLIPINIIIY